MTQSPPRADRQKQGSGQRLRAVFTRLWLAALPKHAWLRRIVVTLAVAVLVMLGGMYGIARWYIWSERDRPLQLGTSFIADYARYLGIDPHQTFLALLNDLQVRHFRLVSYWSDIEPAKGDYNFSELDWEMQQAAAHGATVSLVLGLRQPRWPECHMPAWAQNEPAAQWQPQLEQFMTATVNRYKNSPALQSYQLENEYFLHGFGTCTDTSRARLVSEYNLVKALDSAHPVIIGRSNNDQGWPIGAPTPDEYSVSVYQRVWDATVTHRYLQYPFPSWYYAFLAGWQKIFDHRDMVIGELQAEPWPPHQQNIPDVSLAEQNKSFNAERLGQTVAFARQTGMKTINLWGAEYWYYRLTKLHDSSVWQAAQQVFASS